MKLRRIKTQKDIKLVKGFFHDIFWEETECDCSCFENSINREDSLNRLEYYLGFEKNIPVGITGVYANSADECWLGWFGIRPEYRKKGYATSMLNLQLKLMRKYGYKICRIYTDKIINKVAVSLYKKKDFKQDSRYHGNIITMVKSLDENIPIPKWKGKPFGL